MEVQDTLVRRIARKVDKCGQATVQAPSEHIAHAWARHFESKGYAAHVEEGQVDMDHSWLLIVRIVETAQAVGT